MKRFFLFLSLILFAAASQASDVLTLNNQQKFLGKVKQIRECTVLFKSGGTLYEIPAPDVWTIEFGDLHDKVYTSYLDMLLSDPDACLKGQTDASSFHGKAGLHVVLGVLFGPFAVIGAAVANPRPSTGRETMMMSQNKELFSDATYLDCYKRKARAHNAGNAALGWLAWVVFVLI